MLLSLRLRYKEGAYGVGKTDSAFAVEPGGAPDAGTLEPPPHHGAGPSAALSHCAGLRGGAEQYGGGRGSAGGHSDRGQVAAALCRAPSWGRARWNPPPSSAADWRRGGRAGPHVDFGKAPARRHALVDTLHGQALRVEPERRQSHLARVCSATTSRGNFSALERSAVH